MNDAAFETEPVPDLETETDFFHNFGAFCDILRDLHRACSSPHHQNPGAVEVGPVLWVVETFF